MGKEAAALHLGACLFTHVRACLFTCVHHYDQKLVEDTRGA